MKLILTALLAPLAVSACAFSELADDGSYRYESLACRVEPQAPEHLGNLLGDGWVLRNYALDESGRPTSARDRGDSWTSLVQIDRDDDGDVDLVATVTTYDLMYESREDDARVWLKAVPVTNSTAEKSLRTLAHRWVQGLSGGVYGWNAQTETVEDSRFAANITAETATRLHDHDAYQIDVEVANVDQLRLDPSARSRRLRVLVFHLDGRVGKVGSYSLGGDGLPAIATVVLSSSPAAFERSLPAFDRLTERIAFTALRTAAR